MAHSELERGEYFMKRLLTELIELLETQKELYSNLLDLSISKKDAIVKTNVNELDNIVKAEQILLLRLGEVESKRQRLIEQIAKEYKVNKEEVNLEFVLNQLNSSQKNKVMDIRGQFINILDDITKYNNVNKKLLEKQLSFVSMTLNAITGSGNTIDYNQEGELNKIPPKISIIDEKV